jgi:bacillithiol system protein YtxJ
MKEMIEITDNESLEKALGSKRAVIFKHSTRCPISAAAIQEVMKYCNTCNQDIHIYYMDVIQNRTLSGKTAEITGIVHQSPETIFIINGRVAGYLTHWDIRAEKIEQIMNSTDR